MKPRVTVIDYGVGNLFSLARTLEHCGAEVQMIDSSKQVQEAACLVLPGVGAFADGMAGLRERGLIEPIKNYATSGRPFLGICLGMQMMFDYSEEFGRHEGLGLIPGKVVIIPSTSHDGKKHKIPHIGWNQLVRPPHYKNWDETILSGLQPGNHGYFVHSFTAVPEIEEHRLADCRYNGRLISAAVRSGFLYGCQFHPEKSGVTGIQILKNFSGLKIPSKALLLR